MPLTPGTRLGHYDVTALLGEGGMGQVWQATDTQLGRQVALKILPDAFAADPDRLARFKREAQILASLNHPNIAQIYGIEEAEATRALVLELVEGPTLADRISKGPIPLDEALPIAKQIAEALEAAHEAGVIHRDLKPANIKVREDGTVKVLDFGLAKALDPAPDVDPSQSPTLTAAATQMGVIMGTAAYMSPEQASGATVDKRADIWSFGAVLFEMLTGKRAFDGETVSHVLAAVLKTEPDWAALPTGTPAAVEKLLRRCLAKERRRRVPDIGMARFEIDDAMSAPATEGTDTAAVPPLQVWQRPMPLAAGALVLLLIAGFTAWSLAPPRPLSPGPPVWSVIPVPPDGPVRLPGALPQVAISPDGTRVAYGSSSAAQGARLYVRALDEADATPLRGTEGGMAPFFSPDGQQVGFRGTVPRQLMRISVLGEQAVPICDLLSGEVRGASWGPDDAIIFGTDTPSGLWHVAASGREPEPLTTIQPDQDRVNHAWPHILPGGGARSCSPSSPGRQCKARSCKAHSGARPGPALWRSSTRRSRC